MKVAVTGGQPKFEFAQLLTEAFVNEGLKISVHKTRSHKKKLAPPGKVWLVATAKHGRKKLQANVAVDRNLTPQQEKQAMQELETHFKEMLSNALK